MSGGGGDGVESMRVGDGNIGDAVGEWAPLPWLHLPEVRSPEDRSPAEIVNSSRRERRNDRER